MKEEKFISKNKAKWQSLEQYNTILNKKGIGSFSKEEIKTFTGLYRDISHQLAYARTYFPGSQIILYLNQLVSTSHNHMFIREKTGSQGVWFYFKKGFRRHFRQYLSYFLVSAGLFAAGGIFTFIMTLMDPAWGNYFFPGVDVSGLNLNPESDVMAWLYPLMSSYIMTNNIRVSLMAFALGVTAGVGTIYVLFYNGMVIGALLAIVVSGGGDVIGFWAMILPHGFLELTAIFISGAAGLIIGKHILIPGALKRKDSLIYGGKKAAVFIPGIVVMLIIAGLIEGFFTPLAIGPAPKLLFAFATLLAMVVYFTYKNVPEAEDTGLQHQ